MRGRRVGADAQHLCAEVRELAMLVAKTARFERAPNGAVLRVEENHDGTRAAKRRQSHDFTIRRWKREIRCEVAHRDSGSGQPDLLDVAALTFPRPSGAAWS